ncbi:PKD domain-containing protein [Maribacter sp. X9]|uniref:PKD domain-containing protein n=1 Tax=Maribacter sp. X9 TaxID=3402159 RepID=UPI003AF37927
MMKKKYEQKGKSLKNLFLTIGIVGATALITGFGPMFFGPGMTAPEPFNLTVNTSFPGGGVSSPAYEPAFPNLTFDSPITFNPLPHDNKIIIGQLNGEIYSVEDDNATAQKTLVVNWSAEVGDRNEGAVWDGGFLGLAIHPEFGVDPEKNFMFVYYTTNATNNNLGDPQDFSCSVEVYSGNYLVLARFRVNPTTMKYVQGSRETMIQRELYNTTHRGGGMTFGLDGFLYVSTGDQATYANAQDVENNLDGGVLRLDVDMVGGTTSHIPRRFLQDPGVGNTHPDSDGQEMSGAYYFIPNDNAFNDPAGNIFEEYYTIGHRSPHRLTMDSATGDLYIGEVGEGTHEEINVLKNNSATAGNNYGWPFKEGNEGFTIPERAGTPCTASPYPDAATVVYTAPLTDFIRDEAWSIIGGYVYHGSIAQYQNRYIAGDYITNQLFAIDTQSGAKENLGVGPGEIISFGQDSSGELYMLRLGNHGDSGIFKLKESFDINSAPPLLSQTGVFKVGNNNDFSDIAELSVNEGFIPYEMIESFWSDGAIKTRWMAIPNNGAHDTPAEKIQWSENGDWQFPIGSVLVKQFDFPIDENNPPNTRKIETRFSIKGTDGKFYFLTYKWNDAETDATLVDMATGATASFNVVRAGVQETVDWLYPSNAQCINCHNPALGGTLGPRTRNLNSDFDYEDKGGTIGNQLVTLSSLGILSEDITDNDTPGYLTHKAIDDLNASLDERARSYLDNNCAYCHQPATGNRGDFDLRLFNTLSQTGLYNAGINQSIPAMAPDQQIVYPGDASKSQLYHRANSIAEGIKMPPLAKGIVDTEGVQLIEEWINQLQPPAPAPVEGIYRIVNRASGQTLQVPDASTADMANIAEGGYIGLEYQNFMLENAFGGYHQLKAVHSDKYLDVASASMVNGANIWQYTGNGTDAQLWEILDAGDDTYRIVSKLSGYALGTEPNGNVVVAADNGSDIFRWQFLPIDSPLDLGITAEEEPLVTSEDGTSDEISIVLDGPPTSDVTLLLNGINNPDEFSLLDTEVVFTPANWNIPQSVEIKGVNDNDVDGVQYYTVEISVDVTRSDPLYTGFTTTIEGYNSDDDGGGVGPPALGIYRIFNYASGETLQVPDGSIQDMANITESAYQGLDNQHFELEYVGNQIYKLSVVHSGKYLDVAQGGNQAGVNVWQYEDNDGDSDAQFWRIADAGDGTFHLVSEAGGKYLGTEPNGNVIVRTSDGSDTIRWKFEQPSGPLNLGLTVNPELVVVSEDGKTDSITVVLDGAPSQDVVLTLTALNNADEFRLDPQELTFTVENWDKPQEVMVSGVDESEIDGVQYFDIEIAVDGARSDPAYVGFYTIIEGYNSDDDGGGVGAPVNGIYRVVNRASGETLQVPDASLLDEANIAEGTYGNLDNQHFALEYVGNTLYSLRAVHSSRYLDVSGASIAVGANIWQYEGNGSDAQLWQIVDAGDGTFYLISELSGHYLGTEPDGNVIVKLNDGSDSIRWEFRFTGYPPTAVASSDVTQGDAPLEVAFSSAGSTDDVLIEEYQWDFGDGSVQSTEENPVHTFTTAGSYTVTLTGNGKRGERGPDGGMLTDTDTLTITVNAVNAAPTAVASSDVTQGDAPLEVAFSSAGSTDDVLIKEYQWDFGDGSASSTEENPVHTFTTAGSYTVTLTVTDGGMLTDTDTLTITVNAVNAAPTAVASSDVTQGDAPLEVAFSSAGSTDDVLIKEYQWDFGDGSASSTEENPVHTFTTAGSYTVTLTVTDGGMLTDTDTLTITVNAVDGAPTAVASSDVTQGDAPLEVAFSSAGSTDDVLIKEYRWDFGDGSASSTEENPVHTFTTAGSYTVTLTVTDGGMLTDTDTLTITVNAVDGAPTAVASSDVTQGDAPLEVAFSSAGSTDDVLIKEYRWDFGDGSASSTEENPVHTFTTAGSYTVTLTVTDADMLTDTDTLTITVNAVNAAPTAVATSDVTEIGVDGEVSFTGEASTDEDVLTYLWDFGDGVTATEANPKHTFTVAGTYEVRLTVTDTGGLTNETSISIEVIDNGPNSLDELEIVIAPNPTSEYANVYINNSFEKETVVGFTVHDMGGRLIHMFMESEAYSEQGIYRIPLYGLRDGSYVITIMFESSEPISKRIIVRN